jgi:hypothetical protein
MRSDSFTSVDGEVADLPGYRRLNVLGVLAIPPAMLGGLVLFDPAFLLFPLIALALVGVAFFTQRSGTLLLGSSLNGIVMSLAVFLLCGGGALHYLNAQREYNQAARFATDWLGLLRGKNPTEAYLLSLAYNLRPTREDASVPKTTQASGREIGIIESEQEFLSGRNIAILANPENRLTYLSLARTYRQGLRADYALTYLVEMAAPQPTTSIAIITLFKRPDRHGVVHWQMGTAEVR